MRFRLLIYKDPDARERGYSLAGIKVPLTTLCPIRATPAIRSYDDDSAFGPYSEYWKVPTCLLVLANPNLKTYLHGIDNLLIPTDWADVAPVDTFENLPSKW
jgi:hypothetical protein